MASSHARRSVAGTTHADGILEECVCAARWRLLHRGLRICNQSCGSGRRDTGDRLAGFSRNLLLGFGLMLGTGVLLAVLAEWFGQFQPSPMTATTHAGLWSPVDERRGSGHDLRATLRPQVTLHTLITVGLFAATATGQWPAAVLVEFFMRVADQVEHNAATRARRTVRDLTAMAPETARVIRGGVEVIILTAEIRVRDIVVTRPGEKMPADGETLTGQATVNQAAITEDQCQSRLALVRACITASLAQLCRPRIRATGVGAQTISLRMLVRHGTLAAVGQGVRVGSLYA